MICYNYELIGVINFKKMFLDNVQSGEGRTRNNSNAIGRDTECCLSGRQGSTTPTPVPCLSPPLISTTLHINSSRACFQNNL